MLLSYYDKCICTSYCNKALYFNFNTFQLPNQVAESLSQHDEKHGVPTHLSVIWVGKRRELRPLLI
jgi:hypothetical protein